MKEELLGKEVLNYDTLRENAMDSLHVLKENIIN